MKDKLEKIIELTIIVSLIAFILIVYPDHSFESNLSTIIQFILWIGIYVLLVKWLIPNFLKRKNFKYVAISLVVLVLSILIGLLIKALHLEEMNYRRYYSIRPMLDYIMDFEWWRFKDTVNGILIIFTTALVYGIFRNMKLPYKIIYQKTIPITFFSIIIICVIGFAILVVSENFSNYTEPKYETISKNENIHFIDDGEKLMSFSNIISNINENKAICILFWAKSCGGQIYKVNSLDKMREQINKPIDFVYICGEYKEDKVKWKDYIISNNIEGYNIFLEREKFHKIFIDELGLQNGLNEITLILLDSKHNIRTKLDFSKKEQNRFIERINEL